MVITKASMMAQMLAAELGRVQSAGVMPEDLPATDSAAAQGGGKGQPTVEVGGSMPGCPPHERPSE